MKDFKSMIMLTLTMMKKKNPKKEKKIKGYEKKCGISFKTMNFMLNLLHFLCNFFFFRFGSEGFKRLSKIYKLLAIKAALCCLCCDYGCRWCCLTWKLITLNEFKFYVSSFFFPLCFNEWVNLNRKLKIGFININ